jgi:hypothetical protein
MLQILWQNIHSWMRPHRVAYHARNRRLVLDQFWGLYGGVCHIWGMGNYESHALPKLPTLRWSRRCTAEIFCIQTSQIDHPVVACLWIPNPHQKLPKKKERNCQKLALPQKFVCWNLSRRRNAGTVPDCTSALLLYVAGIPRRSRVIRVIIEKWMSTSYACFMTNNMRNDSHLLFNTN